MHTYMYALSCTLLFTLSVYLPITCHGCMAFRGMSEASFLEAVLTVDTLFLGSLLLLSAMLSECSWTDYSASVMCFIFSNHTAAPPGSGDESKVWTGRWPCCGEGCSRNPLPEHNRLLSRQVSPISALTSRAGALHNSLSNLRIK